MIPPDRVDPRAFRHLTEYLAADIRKALSERRALEERWLKWHRLYKARPERAIKENPFVGASNLVIPLGAIDVDTIAARLSGIIEAPGHVWSTKPLNEDAVNYAPRIQEFLQWAQTAELNVYPAMMDWLLEICKIGTGVLKERYRRDQKLVYEFRETPQGIMERFARTAIHDSPVINHVSIYDFLVPTGAVDHQECEWCAERIMLTPQQLENRARNGIYFNVDRLMAWHNRDRGSWLQSELQDLHQTRPGLVNSNEIWECWTDFDISGIGEPQALLVGMHLQSMTPVRLDYNPFFHQERPFDVARYLRQEKQFYGIGIMEMLEMFQDETTAMHNQRIDRGTLINTPMMKARKGIGITDDEPFIPGRWFLLNNLDDIQPLEAINSGSISTIQDEDQAIMYARQRTGVNDFVMGSSTPSVGYATAQTNILQHQEAARRFDMTLREIRKALGSAGQRSLELYQQFNTAGKAYTVLGQRDGEIMTQVLNFPLELIRSSVTVEVAATSAQLNKEVQIRTNTLLMQMTTQFYGNLFEGFTMALNPQLPEPMRQLAWQMVLGGSIMMRRILDSYDIQDKDRIVPDLQELLSGQAQQLGNLGVGGAEPWASPFGPQAFGGGGPGGQGIIPASGMGVLPPGVGRAA